MKRRKRGGKLGTLSHGVIDVGGSKRTQRKSKESGKKGIQLGWEGEKKKN